jgi:hypothetical protein
MGGVDGGLGDSKDWVDPKRGAAGRAGGTPTPRGVIGAGSMGVPVRGVWCTPGPGPGVRDSPYGDSNATVDENGDLPARRGVPPIWVGETAGRGVSGAGSVP